MWTPSDEEEAASAAGDEPTEGTAGDGTATEAEGRPTAKRKKVEDGPSSE